MTRPQKILLTVAATPFAIVALLMITGSFAIGQLRQAGATGERRSFSHGGLERAYRIHVPNSVSGWEKPVPLVICFHGGGGTAEVASKMGWTPMADENGFIVLYPEGLNKHWNDGRESQKFAEQDAKVDDVGFVLALLEKLRDEFPIDPNRVFVTGASNGGFFSQRMAIEAADRIAAAGVMIATMPKPFTDDRKAFKPARPISILYMNGTKDPFVPYDGGPITPNFLPNRAGSAEREFGRGECSSTDEAVAMWVKHNGLADVDPKTEMLPDKNASDGCTVEKKIWSTGESGISVVLYTVTGGGHTIPGGVQYLPERIIGKTCQDFDGIETVWDFFESHPRDSTERLVPVPEQSINPAPAPSR